MTPKITKRPIEQYIANIPTTVGIEGDSLPKINRLERKESTYFYTTITRLQNRKDIIIKPTTKNLDVPLISSDWYVNKALSTTYLGDTCTYQTVLQTHPLEPIMEQLRTICETRTW